MEYIRRDLEKKILSLVKEYSCILLTGPRQVGKTTVFKEIMEPERAYVTLVLQMPSLSQHELYGQGENRQFTIEMGALKDRKKNRVPADMAEIYERIWNGSMPGYRQAYFSGFYPGSGMPVRTDAECA